MAPRCESNLKPGGGQDDAPQWAKTPADSLRRITFRSASLFRMEANHAV